MSGRTRVGLGVRADLGADCGSCVGLCCVALAFARSADFAIDKAAGEACVHLDPGDGCGIHDGLRERGFKGCTVFDCFGAGQRVTARLAGGASWREDPALRTDLTTAFPVVRRLHELLWYLDRALDLTGEPSGEPAGAPDLAALVASLTTLFDRVHRLADGSPAELAALDVDAEYDAARPLLAAASEHARRGLAPATPDRRLARVGPGHDLAGVRLSGADLRGLSLRGALLLGADLSGAVLTRTDVLGADLRDADLSGADVGEALFLTQMQVAGARGDAATVLPPGFLRPRHWA